MWLAPEWMVTHEAVIPAELVSDPEPSAPVNKPAVVKPPAKPVVVKPPHRALKPPKPIGMPLPKRTERPVEMAKAEPPVAPPSTPAPAPLLTPPPSPPAPAMNAPAASAPDDSISAARGPSASIDAAPTTAVDAGFPTPPAPVVRGGSGGVAVAALPATDGLTRTAVPRGGYQVKPSYPMSARRAGVEGTTLLGVFVGRDGRVVDVVVKQSAGHPDLDRAATDAVRRWHFEPARRGVDAVAMWVELPVEFHLR